MSWLENRRSLKQLLKNWIKHLLRCQDTKPCSESYSGSYCTMLSVLPNPEPCSLFRVPDWTCSEPSLTSTFKTWTTFFFFHHNLKFVIFIFTIKSDQTWKSILIVLKEKNSNLNNFSTLNSYLNFNNFEFTWNLKFWYLFDSSNCLQTIMFLNYNVP